MENSSGDNLLSFPRKQESSDLRERHWFPAFAGTTTYRSECTQKYLGNAMKKLLLVPILVSMSIVLSGCLGFIVGNAVDLGIEVVKVPFKVTKAAVDVLTDDDDDEKKKK